MKTRIIIASALALGTPALTSGVALANPPVSGARAKITVDQARAIALAKVPGTIQDEELEKEKGRWVYSFEIRPDGAKDRAIKEVTIAADDGTVVSVETEDDDEEGEEEENDDD